MICTNCGKEIADDAKFCTFCGSPVSQPPAVPVWTEDPAETIADTAGFVPEEPVMSADGSDFPEAGSMAYSQTEPVFNAVPEEPAQKKSPLKIIIPVVVIAAVVAAAVLLLPKLFTGGEKQLFAYIDDDYELYFLKDLKEKTQSVKIDEDGYDAYRALLFTDDGKYIYYMQIDDPDAYFYDSGTLYCVESANLGKKDPVKVSKSVCGWSYRYVLKDDSILYLKDETTLYHFDPATGSNDKIASDVSDFDYLADQNAIYYTEYDSVSNETDGYLYDMKTGESERLFKSAYTVYSDYRSESYLYSKYKDGEEKLYVLDPGEEEDKILSHFFSIDEILSCEPGNLDFYYFTQDEIEIDYSKLVRDDYSDSDAEMEYPEYPDYPNTSLYDLWSVYSEEIGWTYEDYDSYEHHPVILSADEEQFLGVSQADLNAMTDNYSVYEIVSDLLDYRLEAVYAVYEEEVAAYELASELYDSVADRNYIRETLADWTDTAFVYELHHYVNGDDTVVADNLYNGYTLGSCEDGIFAYTKYSSFDEPVCRIEEMDSPYDIYDYVSGNSQGEILINVNGKETEFEADEDDAILSSIRVLGPKEALIVTYVYKDGSDEYTYGLYEVNGTELKHKKDLEIENYSLQTVYDSDKKQTALYFYNDVNDKSTEGTLYRYLNGEVEKLATDINDAEIFEDGSMICLSYSKGDYELYYNNAGGESKKIGDDVDTNYSYLGDGKVLFIDDEDLKYFDGKEIRKIKSDVLFFWTLTEEYGDYISLY